MHRSIVDITILPGKDEKISIQDQQEFHKILTNFMASLYFF